MVLVGIGVLFAILALACLLLAAVYVLALFVPPWAAAVLVALAVGAVGGGLIAFGATKLKRISLTPERTVTSVQENIQWAKAQAR